MQSEEPFDAKRHLKDIVRVIMQPELNDPYLEPQPAIRKGLSVEAGQYRERNWGTLWLETDPVKRHSCTAAAASPLPTDRSVETPRPASRQRVVGQEALDILRRSHGPVGGIIASAAGDGDRSTGRPRSRLPTAEAKSNEVRQRGSTMRGCLDETQNTRKTVNQPRKKLPTKEAEENYERNRGTAFKNNPYQVTDSKPEQTRTRPCGKALWNEGVCAMIIAGKIPGDPAPGARVKGEGVDIYLRALGSRTFLHHNTYQPSNAPAQPKVVGQGVSRETRCLSAPPPKGRREARLYSKKYPSSVLDCMRRYM